MARINSRWVDVVAGGTIGALTIWHLISVLVAEQFEFSRRGRHHVLSPERNPFFYCLWIALCSGFAIVCLFYVVRGIYEIIRVRRMHQQNDESDQDA
jgi:hypothetical protein